MLLRPPIATQTDTLFPYTTLFRSTLSPVPHIDSKEFELLIALNLVANQRLLAAFDPMLRLGMSPRVIALTASVAASPRPYWGAYGASKAALENLKIGRAHV